MGRAHALLKEQAGQPTTPCYKLAGLPIDAGLHNRTSLATTIVDIHRFSQSAHTGALA
jgi:hypothetical protein